MTPMIKVRKSDRPDGLWVNFIDLKVGDVELSYAPAYFKTHEAAVNAATTRARQLGQMMNDERD